MTLGGGQSSSDRRPFGRVPRQRGSVLQFGERLLGGADVAEAKSRLGVAQRGPHADHGAPTVADRLERGERGRGRQTSEHEQALGEVVGRTALVPPQHPSRRLDRFTGVARRQRGVGEQGVQQRPLAIRRSWGGRPQLGDGGGITVEPAQRCAARHPGGDGIVVRLGEQPAHGDLVASVVHRPAR